MGKPHMYHRRDGVYRYILHTYRQKIIVYSSNEPGIYIGTYLSILFYFGWGLTQLVFS